MKQEQEIKRLLVIDDEENMRHMLTIMADGAGYLTKTAADGFAGRRGF